jgi:phage terminase large subunit GpA-like protein
VNSAQSGKTESILDLIGWRLDRRPCPILYVGPTKQFLNEQFEPRIVDLLTVPSLAAKTATGKKSTKYRKVVGGVPFRLAHAGSPTALKSEPMGFLIIDEYVDMKGKGENANRAGDPLALAEFRGETYADFVTLIVSTPSIGVVESAVDPVNGLDLWIGDPADIECPQWKLFAEGTRYHFAWACVKCGRYFVPRFKLLHWPKGATPYEAERNAWVECPHCSYHHTETDKGLLNAHGLFVAPGQRIEKGQVVGEPPDSSTDSYWTSGLCSPFRSFGQRASAFLTAARSGDMENQKSVINQAFAELWAPTGGDLPELAEVKAQCIPYKMLVPGEDFAMPVGVRRITAGVDVQKNRLVVVIRGWGFRGESWLLWFGELWGETDQPEVWTDLAEMLETPIAGRRVVLALIDSGFRPNKKEGGAESIVYDFCRRHQQYARPSKGAETLRAPIVVSRIEVEPAGKLLKYGLDLIRVNTDFAKLWVHQRIRWPKDQPGAFHLPEDVPDEYCRQLISEARMRKPSGKTQWIQKSKENHGLDCEAMAWAAGYRLGVHRLTGGDRRPRNPTPEPPPGSAPANAQTEGPAARPIARKRKRWQTRASL